MTDDEIKELFESQGQFATGKDYALIRAFDIIIRRHRWVGLTDIEINDLVHSHDDFDGLWEFADAVEATLKAKNERKEKNT